MKPLLKNILILGALAVAAVLSAITVPRLIIPSAEPELINQTLPNKPVKSFLAPFEDSTSARDDQAEKEKSQRKQSHGRRGPHIVSQEAFDQALVKGGVIGGTAPVVENNKVIGYKMRGVSSTARKLGLRNGDVVTSINGVPITSPDAALRAYGSVRKSKRARIVLRRGGSPMLLSYRIE